MEAQPEPRNTPRASTRAASSCKLPITAFVVIFCALARTDDHTETESMPGDTPGTPPQDQQTAQRAAGQVKRQAQATFA